MIRNTCWNAVRAGTAVAFSLLLISGCGGEAGPKLISVAGVVQADGTPLAQAAVSFRPDTAKGNKNGGFIPAGYTDAQGHFELSTTGRKGAPEGWYKVVITPPTAPPGGEMPKVTVPPFNIKYTDAEKTDLSIEVKAGAKAGDYDLKLSK